MYTSVLRTQAIYLQANEFFRRSIERSKANVAKVTKSRSPSPSPTRTMRPYEINDDGTVDFGSKKPTWN